MSRPFALPVVLLLVAAALAGLSHGDRSSPIALQLVEWESTLGLRLWWLAAAPGLGLLVQAALSVLRQPRAGTARPSPRSRPSDRSPPALASGDPRRDLQQSARRLQLPTGARLLVEPSGTPPLRLVLEQCTEHRARRAVEQVAAMLAAGPCPPRLRIDFHRCPPPTTPWHHIVAAALATSIPRGDARVLRQTEGVDVILLKPHPRWSTGG